MKLLKSLLTIALVIVILAAGLNVAVNRGIVTEQALAKYNLTPALALFRNKANLDQAGGQVTNLAERSKELGQGSQQVLGTFIEAEEDGEAFHSKAFEYGRYLYCQQVVKEYEKKNQE